MRRAFPLLLLICLLAPAPAVWGGEADKRPPHADLVLDRAEHDFGVSGQDQSHTTEFTYTNRGASQVEGIAARGECGCNVVKLSHDRLAPGESGTLEVTFHTLFLSGKLRKAIRLYSRDPSRGMTVIPVRIAIIEGLILAPAGVSYGDVRRGTTPRRSFFLKWYEGHGKPFEIQEVEVPGFDFDVRIAPHSDPKDERWHGWHVDLGFKEVPPLGMFSAEVLVRTTHDDHPRVTLPVSANVCGKIWMQARTLTFGSFVGGKPRNASLKFRPFDETVVFGEVTARTREGRIQVQVKPDPLHAKKGFWRLYGTVPADAKPGSLEGEVIELHTGVEGEEVTLVQVKGFVRKPTETKADGR